MSQRFQKDKIFDAASKCLFPNPFYEEDFKKGNYLEEAFVRRQYSIRKACNEDIDALTQLEQLCWGEGMRASEAEINQRLVDSVCLNLVIVYEKKVVGVLYTQRIFARDMKKLSSIRLEQYRNQSGDCMQAVALNISPEYQNLGLGFELLEFALEYFSLDETVKTVCAVTRCRDCAKSGYQSQIEYMKSILHDEIFDDPILRFHQLHGAKVIGLIPNYRPKDMDNEGYGVLVQYQIKERTWVKSIPLKRELPKEDKLKDVHTEQKKNVAADTEQESFCKEFYTYKKEENKTKPMEIAIVGMSGRFPDADSVEEFWEHLKNGVCSIKKAPDDRGYRIEDYYDDGVQVPGKTYAMSGGFLTNVDKFDPLFFKMSYKDAEYTDPSERIFLEEAWRAIEDAGYSPSSLAGRKWGVFACAKGDYSLLIQRESDTYYIPTDSYAGARISYLLNLTGPAMTIDTACSSTAAVVALACNSIMLGECEAAIVGGGSVYSTPNIFVQSSQALLLSRDENCYAFDERANGTVIAEAMGALVLKPLEKAKADKDHIYGVIKGWGLNQDGKTNGMAAPNGLAQTRLQMEIYEKFHINPEDITMIEAHGTGTKLGDAIEYQALRETYRKFTSKENFCALSSIKTNIGHAFLGAGVAGIMNILLCMKYKKIPPILNQQKSSEVLETDHSPFYFNTELKEWNPAEGKHRMAALNSFGVTGTNVHLVFEEYVPNEKESYYHLEQEIGIFILSAKNKDRLRGYVKRFYRFVMNKTEDSFLLRDMMYTLQLGRDDMEERLAFPARTIEDVKQALKDYLEDNQEGEVFYTGYVKKKFQEEQWDMEIESLENIEDARKLCRAWTEGKTIDWSTLYRGELPRKIALPTYPFEQERCWIQIPNVQTKTKQETEQKDCMQLQENPKLDELMLLEEEWVEQPVEKGKQKNNYSCLCFLSKDTYQKTVMKQMRRKYSETICIFVSPANEYGKENEGQYYVKPLDRNSYRCLFGNLKNEGYNFDSVIYLWPYEESLYKKDYQNIQAIIQGMLDSKLRVNTLWICGAYEQEIERCYIESWRGFACSIGPMMARTGINVLVEENAGELDEQRIERILQEAETAKRNQIVLWKQGKRYVPTLKERKFLKKEKVIKTKGTYLVTGGLGGLGQIFAEYLAKNYQASLILTGRKELNEASQTKIAQIRNLGSKVIYLQVDVSDKEQMKIQLEEAQSLLGPVRGIIHAAGTFGETTFQKKDWNEFQKTLTPKVEGVQVLQELFSHQPIDFTCYFSSLSAIVGDFGYCDYAVANAFMMSYARYQADLEREQKKVGRTIAINWPLWRHGSMGMGNEEDSLYLSKSGQRYLENAEGLEAFETILTLPAPQYLVTAGERKGIQSMLHVEQKPKTVEALQHSPKKEIATMDTKDGNSVHRMEEQIEKDLKKLISEQYGIPVGKLEPTEHLMEYGFDSINLYEFTRNISDFYGVSIIPSELLGCTTIADIQEFLIQEYGQQIGAFYQLETETAEVESVEQENACDDWKTPVCFETNSTEPIAIIGISGKFPQSDSVEELWKVLRDKKECITKLPASRTDFEIMKTDYEIFGGFLNEIDEFDPQFFGISPREATAMDPCQRMFLEEAWNTFEDAGYGREALKDVNCGVYVGVEEGDYDLLLLERGLVNGNQNAMLSARIANALELKGPNMSITTSCSSGLTALHQACQSLRYGECDMALTGGIAIMATSRAHVAMKEMEMLSPTNSVYVYDKRADGMVPAEAVVSVLLKPLSKAVKDKDHIYGCILGSGINYCGQGASMMTPNPKREGELIKTVLERYHLKSSDIQFVIGHGMGVKMGDAAEVEALRRGFGKSQEKSCYLSSVKPIVGHTFAASGLVSLAAMLMAMKYDTIFGIHNFENVDDNIDFGRTSFIVNSNNAVWERRDNKPRVGAISSFGNSGANAFAVIGEYVKTDAEQNANHKEHESEDEYIFVYSAKSDEQLKRIVRNHIELLKENQEISLKDIAYTLQIGRTAYNMRLAVVASERKELLDSLEQYEMAKSNQEGFTAGRTFTGKKKAYENSPYAKLPHKYEKMLLEEMLQNRDYEAIAMLWVQGNEVEWDLLYENPGNRVSIPVYPFQAEHYWVGKKESKDYALQTTSSKYEGTLTERIAGFFASELGIEKNQFDVEMPLLMYGVTSILMIKFKRYVEETCKVKITNRDLIEFSTVRSIADFCSRQIGESSQETLIVNEKNEATCCTDELQEYKDEKVMEAIRRFDQGTCDLEQLMNLVGGEMNDDSGHLKPI